MFALSHRDSYAIMQVRFSLQARTYLLANQQSATITLLLQNVKKVPFLKLTACLPDISCLAEGLRLGNNRLSICLRVCLFHIANQM